MNTVGVALVWCVVQVTLVGLLAAGVYFVARWLRPAAAAPVVLTGLVTVVVLSLLVPSPWPRWTMGSLASSADRVGQALPDTLSSQAKRDAVSSQAQPDLPVSAGPLAGAGPRMRADADAAVALKNRPSAAAMLWQAFLDELAKPQATVPTSAWHWPAVMAVLLLTAMACGLGG